MSIKIGKVSFNILMLFYIVYSSLRDCFVCSGLSDNNQTTHPAVTLKNRWDFQCLFCLIRSFISTKQCILYC